MIGIFPEKYGRAGMENPDFGTGIIKMGADAPIPPRARSAAAPGRKPPRRIREGKTALAPPCPEGALRREGIVIFYCVWKISRRILGFPVPLFLPPFISDPFHRYLTVMRVDLDPDRFAVALRSGNKRAPAAHEGIEHGVARQTRRVSCTAAEARPGRGRGGRSGSFARR